MNLTTFKEAYPKFLLLLKDKGYKATTIKKYQWIINRFLSEAQASDIRSFEDYFSLLKGRLSVKSLPEVKTYLGALKHYVEFGVFHRDHSYRSGFMEESGYTRLNEYYRALVDNCLQKCETRKQYTCSTIRSIKSAGSVFCLYYQQHGCKSFGSVKSQQPILEYFHDDSGTADKEAAFCPTGRKKRPDDPAYSPPASRSFHPWRPATPLFHLRNAGEPAGKPIPLHCAALQFGGNVFLVLPF